MLIRDCIYESRHRTIAQYHGHGLGTVLSSPVEWLDPGDTIEMRDPRDWFLLQAVQTSAPDEQWRRVW